MRDTMKEYLIQGAELVGEFGMPQLSPVHIVEVPKNPIPYGSGKSCKNPRESILHFFVDDEKFTGIWSDPDKYLGLLQMFQYVCTPDFSMYADMPRAMQIWNCYRNRALAYYLQKNGVNVIPTAGWSDRGSFKWCFDGLPSESAIAVSNNGCLSEKGRLYFELGMRFLIATLKPERIILIGKSIEQETFGDVPIVCLDGFSQQMRKRMGAKNGR